MDIIAVRCLIEYARCNGYNNKSVAEVLDLVKKDADRENLSVEKYLEKYNKKYEENED